MELWHWAATHCCARRQRDSAVPGAPLDYVASLQRGAERELVAEWKRRFSCGHWEILEGRLSAGDAFRTAKEVKAGSALLFESSACCAAAGPRACEQMARQLEGHARYQEVLQLKGNRFTGETRNPLQSILASNARVCSREPKTVALFVTCSKVPHSCHPNAFLDAVGSHAVLRALDDLPKGTKVTVSYVPVSLFQSARQGQLGKGFQCPCQRCKDERIFDPQLAVPCESCGKGHFFSTGETCAEELCKACGATLSLEKSLRHLTEARKANEFMAERNAAGNELQKALALETRFRTACGSRAVSLRHPQILQLANNVSNCYFYAAKAPGSKQDACWEGFWKYKRLYMEGLEANHGPTRQRDLHFLLSLRRMLEAKFATAKESIECHKMFQDLCFRHFGESDIPLSMRR